MSHILILSVFPVQPEKAPADALVLPECRVLSVLYCGDYSGVDEAWLILGREVKARDLTLAGNPRVLVSLLHIQVVKSKAGGIAQDLSCR